MIANLDLQSTLQFLALQLTAAASLPPWWCLTCSLGIPIDAGCSAIFGGSNVAVTKVRESLQQFHTILMYIWRKKMLKITGQGHCERQHNFPPDSFKFALSA